MSLINDLLFFCFFLLYLSVCVCAFARARAAVFEILIIEFARHGRFVFSVEQTSPNRLVRLRRTDQHLVLFSRTDGR